jgi:hypothetical protein
MTKLLQFLIKHLAFLYNEYQASFTGCGIFAFFHFIKGRSPYNGKLSDFSFYIDSQISVHRKFKKF